MSTNNISSQEAIPDARSTTDHQQSNQTDQGSPDTLKTSSTDIQVCSDDGALPLPTSSKFPESLLNKILAFCDQHGKPYIAAPGKKNPLALRIGSRQANLYLRGILYQAGIKLSSQDLRDLNDDLQAHAELSGVVRDVYIRVAPYKDGIEIDRGDNDRTRIRVTSGKVEIVRDGSEIFFYRPTVMRELPMPADHGDLTLFDKFTNIHPVNRMLMYAFMSYTLAHPKVPTTNYPILTVTGEEGSSKSTLCKFTQQLIDPSIVGAQSFPKNQQDLVIAAEQSHLLIYDNIRIIKHSMADTLCIAASGGTVTNRKLYTDDDLHVNLLHASFILNGIHPFVDQPDLAQRCLPIHLQPIDQKNRQSEAELTSNFETDLPVIFRGLLNLVADVLSHLPSAEITNPERMFEFSRWLAAMEKSEGVPPGIYQAEYSYVLNEAMRDSLLESPLAEAVVTFFADHPSGDWSGRPAELLEELNTTVSKRTLYSHEWPLNASALSKRLLALQAGLRRQGIDVKLSRGKHRTITISRMEGASDE